MFYVCTHVHVDRHVCVIAIVDTLCFGGDLTKPIIANAGVDRMY